MKNRWILHKTGIDRWPTQTMHWFYQSTRHLKGRARSILATSYRKRPLEWAQKWPGGTPWTGHSEIDVAGPSSPVHLVTWIAAEMGCQTLGINWALIYIMLYSIYIYIMLYSIYYIILYYIILYYIIYSIIYIILYTNMWLYDIYIYVCVCCF